MERRSKALARKTGRDTPRRPSAEASRWPAKLPGQPPEAVILELSIYSPTFRRLRQLLESMPVAFRCRPPRGVGYHLGSRAPAYPGGKRGYCYALYHGDDSVILLLPARRRFRSPEATPVPQGHIAREILPERNLRRLPVSAGLHFISGLPADGRRSSITMPRAL